MTRMCEVCGTEKALDMIMGVYFCERCKKLRREALSGNRAAAEQILAYPCVTLSAKQLLADSLSHAEQSAQIRHNRKNMILTTAPFVEGMHVTKQLGLCFGEVVFKASFTDRLSASFEDALNMFSFSETEMEGTAALLDRARQYAIEKMKDNAAAKGANAIIGIDTETSYGANGITHITMCGTAVYAVPDEEASAK